MSTVIEMINTGSPPYDEQVTTNQGFSMVGSNVDPLTSDIH